MLKLNNIINLTETIGYSRLLKSEGPKHQVSEGIAIFPTSTPMTKATVHSFQLNSMSNKKMPPKAVLG